MVSSSCPIMNVHGISSNEEVSNMQVAQKGGELEISKVINVGKDDSNAYIIEMHLENL
jgi:subtilase family serine protease